VTVSSRSVSRKALLNRPLANFARDLEIELLDVLPFLDQINFLVGGELLTQHRAHLHATFDVQDQFRDFVRFQGVPPRLFVLGRDPLRRPSVWPPTASSVPATFVSVLRLTPCEGRAWRLGFEPSLHDAVFSWRHSGLQMTPTHWRP
jgi:hypothetical protein